MDISSKDIETILGRYLSDMEREDFKRQIAELLQGMTTLSDRKSL